MKKAMKIKVINRSAYALPQYETAGAAGMDVRADIRESIVLGPLERTLVPTGLYVEIPDGYEIQVRPRRGLPARHGVSLVNSPGTMDPDYRGESDSGQSVQRIVRDQARRTDRPTGRRPLRARRMGKRRDARRNGPRRGRHGIDRTRVIRLRTTRKSLDADQTD